MTTSTQSLTRETTITRIKAALKRRSGKPWSVTGGKGTAWGWLTIDAPPSRRTWHWITIQKRDESGQWINVYEDRDLYTTDGHSSPADRAELASLLHLSELRTHYQGHQVSDEHWQEYIDRVEVNTPNS